VNLFCIPLLLLLQVRSLSLSLTELTRRNPASGMESASALPCIPHCTARTSIAPKHSSMELEESLISDAMTDAAAAAAAAALVTRPQPTAPAAGETALHTMMSSSVHVPAMLMQCLMCMRVAVCPKLPGRSWSWPSARQCRQAGLRAVRYAAESRQASPCTWGRPGLSSSLQEPCADWRAFGSSSACASTKAVAQEARSI
jgi:hypothetical protein